MADGVRVVHVVVAGDIGGAERLLIDLATHPVETEATHAVALLTSNPKLKRLFQDAGLVVHDGGPIRENPIAYLRRSLGFSTAAWIAGVMVRENAEVAHLHTLGSHVVGTRAALRARVPILRTEHHTQYFIDPSSSAFTRWSLRRVDRSVAISRYVGDFVAHTASFAAPKLRVVRNGVDAQRFAAVAPPSPGGPFTFAVVSRLERWKRIDRVIAALESVAGARLIIVGDGSERRALEKVARRLHLHSRVEFRGFQADPREAIAEAHACVNASDDEPLGLAVLEAMSSGRLVVAYAGGAMPELIASGERGWLVAQRSAEALARAMLETASDRRRAAEMGLAARAFIEKECTIETMCRQYGAIYRELAAR
ncbi:MAG TPA: glycosyltransferase family 4 protein [Polyangiaceae bacterium]